MVVDFVGAVTSFSEPAGAYPEINPEIPVDTSAISQDKKGDLTVEVEGLSITTSTPEKSPVRLNKDGIWMKENSLALDSTPRLYWDDITSWSNATDGIYYNDGNVGIGTANLNAKLDVGGQLDMNNNKIINVGSPTGVSDIARKGYVDSDIERVISDKVYIEKWGDNPSSVYVSDGPWDFCFLTEFERNTGVGFAFGDGYKRIEESGCDVIKDANGWKLEVRSDDRAWTRCAARCIKVKPPTW